MEEFDLIVIGGGPAGYPAAIRGAQLGAKVALVEEGELGGTCLNRGCIPSKALIASARRYHEMVNSEAMGISAKGVSFDYPKMVQRSQTVVSKIRKGLTGLLQANGVTVFRGRGKFTAPKEIKVTGEDKAHLRGNKIIIASGSEPRVIPAFPCDGKKIHDSTSLLLNETCPKELVVIGGGVIGCEFASMFSLLGVKVTILEMLPRILSTECQEISSTLEKSFKKRGIVVHTGAKVKGIKNNKNGVLVEVEGQDSISADSVLVSVGRKVNSDAIGLEKAGLKTGENGRLITNEKMETEASGIYAVGDVTGKWWLAHVGTHAGLVAASNALGHSHIFDERAIPSVVFTDPEIASVGMSPEMAKEKGRDVVIGKFPFQALGKSQAIGHTEGFAQVVADKDTGEILGAQVIGEEASALISEMTLAIQNELTLDCLTETIHAHPTLPEAWMEAGLLASGIPLHMPPSKKE